MTKVFRALNPIAYVAFRLVFAFLYWSHGLRWLFGAFGGRPAAFGTLVWSAGVIETVCGALMLLGVGVEYAAFIACGEMAVAYFMVHNPRGHVPIANGGEITVALCFGFLYMATRGAGGLSIDALRGRK